MTSLRSCANIDEYLRDPVGSYIRGEAFLHFYLEPRLNGLIVVGRPDEQDARLLCRILEVELLPAWRPEASVIDARSMEALQAAAFNILGHYLSQRWRQPGPSATRQAIIRPEGSVGALVAGFLEVNSPPGAWKVFAGLREALAWLGGGELDRRLAKLEELRAVASKGPSVLHTLRDRLLARPAGATLAGEALALGMSSRSLQRLLREAGTTFRAELQAAQVQAAMALLLDSDAKLTTIAYEIGCASPQHFSTLFHLRTGEAPSAWRKRRRP